jgi:AcrR family transcriptional regulator
MVRDATATRARLLAAAVEEFAEHGLAGARVDRLAERAATNKQLIYAYFGSKDGLFDAVLAAGVGQLVDLVPFDARDLPGYCQRLFDFTQAHPELVRLARWSTLERPGVLASLPVAVDSTARKLAAVAAAQKAGVLDSALPAPLLLSLVLSLAHASAEDVLLETAVGKRSTAARRKALGVAVSRIVMPG